MSFKRICLVFSVTLAASFALRAAPTKEEGKALFTANCATCHAKDMKSKLTGPPLAGSQAKWGDDKALYSWVRNSQAMIASGSSARATEIWNEYKPTVMNSFPNLTDDQIASIFLWVDCVTVGCDKPTVVNTGSTSTEEKESDAPWMFIGLALILGLLAFALMRIIDILGNIARVQEGDVPVQKTWVSALTSKGFIAFAVFALVLIFGYKTVDNATRMGRTQNYEPDQPIAFSHKIHAGVNKIDCQYCHDGARRSKHASIPAANTCMNCHSAVKVGTQSGTAEITKIYASIGFDPNTGQYIKDYESWSDQKIEELYKRWIGQTYMEKNTLTALDDNGRGHVQTQWEGIVKALKNDGNGKIQGPIEWTRIHNLPDHAYFNHAQHVSVGKVECQKCHGQIQEMDVVYQYSTLGMGWCINCHRETEVKFKDNDYYKQYERYHEEIKAGKRDKVTVADIGGLECQKCHY